MTHAAPSTHRAERLRPRLFPLASALLLGALAPHALAQKSDAESKKPWRLQSLLPEDSWLRLSGSARFRYEGIEGQFRAASRLDGSDHLFVQRTNLRADAVFDPASFTVEILDSRHWGGGTGSALATSSVNALDFLQVYAGFEWGEDGDQHKVRVGRQTLDLGSRRLVARNRYRNTINSFTGVDWAWKSDDSSANAFWYLPVRRRPRDLNSILDNEIDLDDQDIENQFLGLYFDHELDDAHKFEVYAFGLLEEDSRTRKRELITPGGRIVRSKARGSLDYQLEAAYQFGESRTSSSGADLDHSAWFQHASVGYTFDMDWSPRVRLAFDYASGDRDPNDGDNNRFDTLFGARRFEYGPTGIFGAIARSNLLSPELRLEVKPASKVQGMFAWRSVWLASDKDAWTTSGVRDSTGAADRFVGQQIETRWRWDIAPKSLRLELGAAHIFHGEFQHEAVGGQGRDSTYAYAQIAWTF